MGASFPSSILELEGTAPGKWPRDGLRIVYRLRSQNGFHGVGVGQAGRGGRSFVQPEGAPRLAASRPSPVPRLPRGAFALAVTEQSRCGCQRVCITATPVHACSPWFSRSEVLRRH